jgi:hypothetical protein
MRRRLTVRAIVAAAGAVAVTAAAFGVGIAVGEGRSDSSARNAVERGDDRAAETGPPPTAPPVSLLPGPAMEEVTPDDPEKGTRQGSPLNDLPGGVRALTDVGQRPDWSPDGASIVFLDDSPLGDVWTVDVGSGETRNLTEDLDHHGFARAYYLSNGDLLLCGPTSGPRPSDEFPEAGRFTGVMSVFRAPFDEAPVPLGMPCWEGIAAARTSLRIAWNRSDIDYTDTDLVDRVVNGITEIWTGELRYEGDSVSLVDVRKVLDRDAFGHMSVFEVQAFRPPAEEELILTAYAYQGGEVLGLDLKTGAVRNYSNSSAYEEAEGVDASGDAVYVERDLDYDGVEPGALDIWRLGLDDGGWERVTQFNRYAPYYASNPAISPGGEQLAFQLSIDGDTEGEGDGILLLDLT